MKRSEAQGKLIKDRREELKLPQRKIADRLKVHKQFISNIERGLAPIPPYYIAKLCAILELKPEAVINAVMVDYRNEYTGGIK